MSALLRFCRIKPEKVILNGVCGFSRMAKFSILSFSEKDKRKFRKNLNSKRTSDNIFNDEKKAGSSNDTNSDESPNSEDFDEKKSEALNEQFRTFFMTFALGILLTILVPSIYQLHNAEEYKAQDISMLQFTALYLQPLKEKGVADYYFDISGNRCVYVRRTSNNAVLNSVHIHSASDFEHYVRAFLADSVFVDDAFDQLVANSFDMPQITKFGVVLISGYVLLISYYFSQLLFPARMRNLLTGQIPKLLSQQSMMPKKKFTPVTNVTTKFTDVIGYNEQKTELFEFVQFLKDPKKFNALGAKIPRGAILYGPPGTGKTLLAKAVAGEAGVNFFSLAGPEFVEVFVGVGSQRMRDLFEAARKAAPAIVFIDEIDSIAANRSRAAGYAHSEQEATLNQLLAETDGMKTADNVVILAATNRYDTLDSAVLRPGRLDRHLYFGAPELQARRDMFRHYLQNTPLSEPIESIAGRMAELSVGFVGADIAMLCNEASIVAVRNAAEKVRLEHFNEAFERIRLGNKQAKKLSPAEKYVIAVREAAKAAVAFYSENAAKLLRVSIVPRSTNSDVGSVSSMFQDREQVLHSREALLDSIKVMLAGRAAEEVLLGEKTSLAGNELTAATKLAYQHVGLYGMNKSVGSLSFASIQNNVTSVFPLKKQYAGVLGDEIDAQVDGILKSEYGLVKGLLEKNRQKVIDLARFIYKNESAEHETVDKFLK